MVQFPPLTYCTSWPNAPLCSLRGTAKLAPRKERGPGKCSVEGGWTKLGTAAVASFRRSPEEFWGLKECHHLAKQHNQVQGTAPSLCLLQQRFEN